MATPTAQPMVAALGLLAQTRRRRRMGTVEIIDTLDNGVTVVYCSTALSTPGDATTYAGPFGVALGYAPTVGDAVWVWAYPPQWLCLGLRSTA